MEMKNMMMLENQMPMSNSSGQPTTSPMGHMTMNEMGEMGGQMGGMMGGMSMYFHASSESTILFKGWKTTSPVGMFFSCLAILSIAILYEGLKVFRKHLLYKVHCKERFNQRRRLQNMAGKGSFKRENDDDDRDGDATPSRLNNPPISAGYHTGNQCGVAQLNEVDQMLSETQRERPYSENLSWQNRGIGVRYLLKGSHLIQSALHGLQTLIGFLLMLVFMTYNVWLCLAVILGAALGHYLFGWSEPVGFVGEAAENHCN